MKIFSDCSHDCLFCKYFYLQINCLAGHGDNHFTPAKKSQVFQLFNNKITSGNRKLEPHELAIIKTKLDHWPWYWPK